MQCWLVTVIDAHRAVALTRCSKLRLEELRLELEVAGSTRGYGLTNDINFSVC
jgi:hypothetical protein